MTDAKGLLPGFEERFAEIKGVRLRYYVGGNGPPIALIHGLGGAATNWTLVAPELARSRRVIVPDLPGHGGSAPLAAAPTLEPYADRVHRLLEREAALPAPLVGHSLGALVALRLAIRAPEAVTAVVLVSAAGIFSTSRRARYALKLLGVAQPMRLLAHQRGRVARSPFLRTLFLSWWTASDPVALSPRAVEGLLAGPTLHTDVVSAARALVADDPRDDLGGVLCPCLVVHGANDLQIPVGDAIEYARRLRAPLRIVPDASHLVIGERPEACADAIERFVGATL